MRWLALALLLPSLAQASGYYYSDSGIVATGRGGAWVAGADTQFAQYHNPAGLIRIDQATFNIGWSGVTQNAQWRQQGLCADQLLPGDIASCANGNATFFYPEAENGAPPFNVPQLGFVAPVADNLVLAIGFISPYAPSSEWDADGPQRYTIIDSSIYKFGIGPSAAWQPIKQVTFGAGFQWSYLSLGRSLNLTMNGLDDPGGDIFVNVSAKDSFTPSWNVGLLIEPTEDISFGFAATPPTAYDAKGEIEVDFAGNALESEFEPLRYSGDARLAIDLPLILRAGVAIRPISRLEVEFAWVWQQWSSLDEIRITDVDMTVGFTDSSFLNDFIPEEDRRITGPFNLPAGLKDGGSYRFGAEYRFNDAFEGRAGTFYEPSAVPEELVTVSLVDAPKWQVGGGGSVWIPNTSIRFDMAFAWIFLQDLQIRNSEVRQVTAGVFDCGDDDNITGAACSKNAAIIGNGDVSSSGWIVGLQAQYAFGPKKEK